jgi:hypothetical protein
MSAASTQLLRDGLRIRARLQLENAHVHPLQRLRGDVGQRFRAHQGRPIIDDRTAQGIGADDRQRALKVGCNDRRFDLDRAVTTQPANYIAITGLGLPVEQGVAGYTQDVAGGIQIVQRHGRPVQLYPDPEQRPDGVVVNASDPDRRDVERRG